MTSIELVDAIYDAIWYLNNDKPECLAIVARLAMGEEAVETVTLMAIMISKYQLRYPPNPGTVWSMPAEAMNADGVPELSRESYSTWLGLGAAAMNRDYDGIRQVVEAMEHDELIPLVAYGVILLSFSHRAGWKA